MTNDGPVPGDRQPHLRYLDGLRGIAILMVLLIHATVCVPGLPQRLADLGFYGIHGVQLFFIVSGLTLTVAHRGTPLGLRAFALRRFLRIAPMFYLGAALYLAIGRFTALPYAPHAVRWPEVVGTLLFVHGWMPDAINKIVPGGWSIAAEAMFYVAFPLLLALRGLRLGLAVVATFPLAIVTYMLLLHLTAGDPDAYGFPFYFWLSQLPAFALGCWLEADVAAGPTTRTGTGWALAAAALAMVIDSQFRMQTNLLISVLLLGAFVWAAGRARPGWLRSPGLTLLGRLSFSLYLLHFLVLALVAPPVVALALPAPVRLALLYLAALLATVPLAYATHRLVERPAIRLGRRLTAPAAG